MKKTSILTLFFACSFSLQAQLYRVEAYIENLPDQKVYLSRFHQDEYLQIDSMKTINGSFYFTQSAKAEWGMYRFDFVNPGLSGSSNNNKYIEFLWNSESFSIYANYLDLTNSVIYGNSTENSIMEEFRLYEQEFERKISLITPLVDQYPEDDPFYSEIEEKYFELQVLRDSFLVELSYRNSGSLAFHIIKSYRSPLVLPDLKGASRIAFLREHYFEKSPINDPALLNVPVYNRRIIEYLMFYRNPEYTFSEQEDEFQKAVDIIMANVSGDLELRAFVVEYLLGGFESFGMERIQTYIVDTYVDETCATDETELAKERVEGFREMSEGMVAEDILIRNENDEMVQLSAVDADYKLVVFWASYCVHCQEMMPELKEWYLHEKPQNLEVFTVSIDTVKADWENYIHQHQLPWIDTHEPMGWEGKSAEDYNIYATPTMFLLGRDLEILARPFSVRELQREVRKFEDD